MARLPPPSRGRGRRLAQCFGSRNVLYGGGALASEPRLRRVGMSARPPSARGRSASAQAADAERLYTIGDLAEALAVTTRAIRFYEAKGLIAPARRGVARSYSRRDRARLMLILRGKNLGFSLEEIAQYLALYDADPAQVAQTRMLLTRIEAAIADLQTKRADLDRTLRELKDIRAQCVEHLSGHSPGGRPPR